MAIYGQLIVFNINWLHVLSKLRILLSCFLYSTTKASSVPLIVLVHKPISLTADGKRWIPTSNNSQTNHMHATKPIIYLWNILSARIKFPLWLIVLEKNKRGYSNKLKRVLAKTNTTWTMEYYSIGERICNFWLH